MVFHQLSYRTTLLAGLACGVGISVLQVMFHSPPRAPSSSVPKSLASRFPLVLNGWQLDQQAGIPLPPQQDRYERIVEGQRYIYKPILAANPADQGQPANQQLAIEIRQIQSSSGDLTTLQQKYPEASRLATVSPDSQQTSQTQIQSSAMGTYQSSLQGVQTHLQTCLTASGRLSVTAPEFEQQVYHQALSPQKWIRWLTGKQLLIDNRCWWIQIRLQCPEFSQKRCAQVSLEPILLQVISKIDRE